MADSISTIPVKIKIVRECANARKQVLLKKLDDELAKLAQEKIERIEQSVKARASQVFNWFGLSKRTTDPTPTVEELVSMWKSEFRNGTLHPMTSPWWVHHNVVKSEQWSNIVTLSQLPEIMDEEVMHLTISDARMLKFNRYIKNNPEITTS